MKETLDGKKYNQKKIKNKIREWNQVTLIHPIQTNMCPLCNLQLAKLESEINYPVLTRDIS